MVPPAGIEPAQYRYRGILSFLKAKTPPAKPADGISLGSGFGVLTYFWRVITGRAAARSKVLPARQKNSNAVR